jgi:microcystin-dependent protein
MGNICYVTEPSAYRGNVKIGDTVKFIGTGDVDLAFPIHDVRDSIFNTPDPGWYGLLTNTSATSSSQYNSIFKLDKNGVIIDKVIISLSDNCLPAISPTPAVVQDSGIGGSSASIFEVEATDDVEAGSSSVFLPTGSIVPYAGPTAPDGWLLCDGSVVNIFDYPDLSNIIQTQFGSSTSTTFTLPDLRGRVVAGVDNMDNSVGSGGGTAGRLSYTSIGLTAGAESHLITSSQAGIPSHSHITYSDTNNNTTVGGGGTRVTALADPGATETGSTNNVEEDATASHNNVQPTIILNYIIKT